MRTILILLLVAGQALAEDCNKPNPYTNITIKPQVEIYRFNPRKRLVTQANRRTKRKHTDTFTYFVNHNAKVVTATVGALGWEKSYGTGRFEDLAVALKIAQGYENAADFNSWWTDSLIPLHEQLAYNINCSHRNRCRKTYLPNKRQLTACFLDLRKWPENRTMLDWYWQGFGELVSIKAGG